MPHPLGELAHVVAGGQLDVDLAQAQRREPATRATAVPDVHRHVVVVAPRAHEQRLAAQLRRGVEAEPVDVELLGGTGVTHGQVDVAHDRVAGACRLRRLRVEVLAQEVLGVQVEGGHLDLPVDPAPLGPVAVPVQLDAVALRVVQVEGLADQVVGAAGEQLGGLLRNRGQHGGQLGLRREEDRGVEQPRGARCGVLELRAVAQQHDGRRAAAQRHHRPLLGDHLQGDDVAVERRHPLQVGDVQGHRAHGGVGGETVGTGGGCGHGGLLQMYDVSSSLTETVAPRIPGTTRGAPPDHGPAGRNVRIRPGLRPRRGTAGRTGGCRRCGSTRPRRGCRCAGPRRTPPAHRPPWRPRP